MLSTPPSNFKELTLLVENYNKLGPEAHLQKIYHLQKINFLLNKTEFNLPLLEWVNNASGANSWKANLRKYGINPDASIFLKGFQFAEAVSQHIVSEEKVKPEVDKYVLMQARDSYLDINHEPDYQNYVYVSLNLAQLARSDSYIKTTIARQLDILHKAKQKIAAIQGEASDETEKKELTQLISSKDFEHMQKQLVVDALQLDPMAIDKDEEVASNPIDAAINYETKPLGDQQGNNKNFILHIQERESEQKIEYVFRVEDRSQLAIEQQLHSYPVSQYFIEDIAVFRMAFLEEKKPTFRPVVLSQFANQGNLVHIASSLKKAEASQADIAATTKHYFYQLSDCCLKLMEAGYYHPDIKLSNFLVHRNRVLISDRKTIITTKNPTANKILSSPLYAPDEYVDCLDFKRGAFKMSQAKRTNINMPEFMSYELGMALKEFLLLTQYEEIDDNILRDHSLQAADIFDPLNPQIANLWLLAQELTRPKSKQRLSIKTFRSLLLSYVKSNEKFYEELENSSSSEELGQEVTDKLKNIRHLLSVKLEGEYIEQANKIFSTLAVSDTTEHRLIISAQTLAHKYYEDHAKKYFSDLADSINKQLLDEDLKQAPWLRWFIHHISWGYFRVDEVTDIKSISIIDELQNQKFQTEVYPHLNYLPLSTLKNHLGIKVSEHIKNSIQFSMQEDASSSDDKESEEKIDERVHEVVNKRESLPSETFVVTGESEKSAQPVFSGTFINKDDDKEISMSNATFVVTEESEKSAQPSFSGTFINKDDDKEKSMSNGTFVVTEESENSAQPGFSGTFINKDDDKEISKSNATFVVTEESENSEEADFGDTFIDKAAPQDGAKSETSKKDETSKKRGKKRHNIPDFSNESEKEPLLSVAPNGFFNQNKRLSRVLSVRSTLFKGDAPRQHEKESSKP